MDFEKQFDLLTVFINGSNGGGSQSQLVSKKKEDFFFLGVVDPDAMEKIRAFLWMP